jgi:hypothetical protein
LTFVGYTHGTDLASLGELDIIPIALRFPLIEYDCSLTTQGVYYTGILFGGVHRVHLLDIIAHFSDLYFFKNIPENPAPALHLSKQLAFFKVFSKRAIDMITSFQVTK